MLILYWGKNHKVHFGNLMAAIKYIRKLREKEILFSLWEETGNPENDMAVCIGGYAYNTKKYIVNWM